MDFSLSIKEKIKSYHHDLWTTIMIETVKRMDNIRDQITKRIHHETNFKCDKTRILDSKFEPANILKISLLLKDKIQRYHREVWFRISVTAVINMHIKVDRGIRIPKILKKIRKKVMNNLKFDKVISEDLKYKKIWKTEVPKKTNVKIRDLKGELKNFLINLMIFIDKYYGIQVDSNDSIVNFNGLKLGIRLTLSRRGYKSFSIRSLPSFFYLFHKQLRIMFNGQYKFVDVGNNKTTILCW